MGPGKGHPVGSAHDVPFFPMLKVRRLRLNFSPPRSGPPIGPDWYDGAELIRVETRDLGWFLQVGPVGGPGDGTYRPISPGGLGTRRRRLIRGPGALSPVPGSGRRIQPGGRFS